MPVQSGLRIELGEASVDVAANVYDLEIGTGSKQLGPAPEAAGGDDPSPGQVAPAERPVPDERVAGILTDADRRDGDSRWQLGGQILERVNREIDPALEQGVVDLLGEERPAPDLGQGYIRRSGRRWS